MTRNEAPATTNYTLSSSRFLEPTATIGSALRRLAPLMADEKQTVALAFLAIVVSSASSLLAPVIIGRAVDVNIRNQDFRGPAGTVGAPPARLRDRALRHVFSDAADGQRRTTGAVQAAQRALHEAAAAAARLLQPEQVGRSHLENQQRHGQAESVFRAVARAARQQHLPDGRRRHPAADAQSASGHRGPVACGGCFGRDSIDLDVGQAEEPEGPAVARRPERGNSGESEQLQGHRRVQPSRLFSPEVRRSEPAELRRVGEGRDRQQYLRPDFRAGIQPGAARGAVVRRVPDCRQPADDRRPHRRLVVRQQLLHAASPARRRVGVVSACPGRARSCVGRPQARVEHADCAR